jgi:hypothetical protein
VFCTSFVSWWSPSRIFPSSQNHSWWVSLTTYIHFYVACPSMVCHMMLIMDHEVIGDDQDPYMDPRNEIYFSWTIKMHNSLYIGVWYECFFFHISNPKKSKIVFFFEISLCVLTPKSSVHVLTGLLGFFLWKWKLPMNLRYVFLKLAYRNRFFLASTICIINYPFFFHIH